MRYRTNSVVRVSKSGFFAQRLGGEAPLSVLEYFLLERIS